MASISPISDALSAASTAPLVLPPSNNANSTPTLNATASAATTATPDTTTTQPLNLVYDALATAGLDSALDETLFAPPTVQASGAFANFTDQLFAAIAAQQAETAAAQSATATEAATTTAAAAAFASNTASIAPNSALESNVQALATQAQAAYTGTSNTAATATESNNALLPLQQSFDDLIASAGGATSAAALPTFLEALANNLHTVPSPLGNLVDSST
jgi:hypothetical protein